MDGSLRPLKRLLARLRAPLIPLVIVLSSGSLVSQGEGSDRAVLTVLESIRNEASAREARKPLEDIALKDVSGLVRVVLGRLPEDWSEEPPIPELESLRQATLIFALRTQRDRSYAELFEALGEKPSGDEVAAALPVIVELGGGATWHALCDAVSRLEPISSRSPTILGVFAQCVGRHLDRDHLAYRSLPRSWTELPPAFRGRYFQVLRDRGGKADIALLLGHLGQEPSADGALLQELTQVPPHLLVHLDRRQQDLILRKVQRGESREEQIAAIRVSARCQMERARDDYLSILAGEDPELANHAVSALQELTGGRLGNDPAGWEAWIEGEQAWIEGPLEEVLNRMRSPEVSVVLQGIRDARSHRMAREHLSETVSDLLFSEDVTVRLAALELMEDLRTYRSLKAVMNALEDENQQVRQRAQGVLVTLTKSGPHPDPTAWRAALKL